MKISLHGFGLKTCVLQIILFFPLFSAASGSKESYNHFTKALLLERKGEFQKALEEYKTTVLMDPDAFFAYRQAVNLAFRLGKLDDADKWSEYLVRKDSSSVDTWILRGNFFWVKGDSKKARECFLKAIKIDPENKEAIYQLAGIYSLSEPEKGIEYFKRYAELAPENAADAYYKVGTLYSLSGNYRKMEEYLKKAAASDAYYLPPRYMLAEYYELKKDTQSAINQYMEIFKINPNDKKLLNYLGRYYLSVGDLRKGREFFLRAHNLDNSDQEANFWLAVLSEKDGDYASAIKYLSLSKDLDTNPKKILQLSYYHTQNNDYHGAVKILERANKKWPKNAEISYFLSLGYMDLGQEEKAYEILKKAALNSPGDINILTQLGMLAESLNDVETMEKSFKEILKGNPKNDVILNYLGYSLADRGLKLKESEGMIKKALEISPNNAAYMDSLGWVHFKLGKKEAALEEIRKSIEMFYKNSSGKSKGVSKIINDDPVVWEHLGDIYWSMGEVEKAYLCWKNSYFVKVSPKVMEKIEEARDKMEPAREGAILRKFFSEYSSALRKFSSFCRIKIRMGAKKISLDGILIWRRTDSLVFRVLSPMFTPLWEARYDSGGGLKADDIKVKDNMDMQKFKGWIEIFVKALHRYYGGDFFISAGSRAPLLEGACFKGEEYEVCFDKVFEKIKKIKSIKSKKASIYFRKFINGEFRYLPDKVELKAPFSKVEIEFYQPKADILPLRFLLPE